MRAGEARSSHSAVQARGAVAHHANHRRCPPTRPRTTCPGVVLTSGAYRTSLRALVRVASAGGGAWSSSWRFMDALSWEVWVALVVTSLGVGALIWAAEVATQNARAAPAALQATCWDALGRPTQARDLVTFSAAGSLLALMFRRGPGRAGGAGRAGGVASPRRPAAKLHRLARHDLCARCPGLHSLPWPTLPAAPARRPARTRSLLTVFVMAL